MKVLLITILIVSCCVPCVHAFYGGWNQGDLNMQKNSINGDSTDGLVFDPNNDGTNEVTMTSDGGITLTRSGECVITLTDSVQTAHNLTVDASGDIYIDGVKKT